VICTRVNIDGVAAIVCGSRLRRKRCRCGNGQFATLLCDWKVPGGTCDAPLCPACTYVPAIDKDLCPDHAAEWKARPFRAGLMTP
jgi:hypothetical protein